MNYYKLSIVEKASNSCRSEKEINKCQIKDLQPGKLNLKSGVMPINFIKTASRRRPLNL